MYIANHVVRARLISERVFFYEFLMDFFKKRNSQGGTCIQCSSLVLSRCLDVMRRFAVACGCRTMGDGTDSSKVTVIHPELS